jgi:hypothetical protein
MTFLKDLGTEIPQCQFAQISGKPGETRMGPTPARVRQILEHIAAAITDTSKELRAYMKAHAEFIEIGNRMFQRWEQGIAQSLRAR